MIVGDQHGSGLEPDGGGFRRRVIDRSPQLTDRARPFSGRLEGLAVSCDMCHPHAAKTHPRRIRSFRSISAKQRCVDAGARARREVRRAPPRPLDRTAQWSSIGHRKGGRMPSTELESRIVSLKPDAVPACLVFVRNATPSNRRANVIGAGVHFFDATGANFLVGPIPVDLGPGAGIPFVMNDPRFVVAKVEVGVIVRVGDPPPGASVTHIERLVFEPKPEQGAPAERVIELNVDLRASRTVAAATTVSAAATYALEVRP